MSARRAAARSFLVSLLGLGWGCQPAPELPRDPTLAMQLPSLESALREMPKPAARTPLGLLLRPIETPATRSRWLPATLALLGARADLRPVDLDFRPSSAAAFFGWVRSRGEIDQVYWCVDLGSEQSDGVELLAARGSRSWRSGKFTMEREPGALQLSQAFAPERALASLRIDDDAEGFSIEGRSVRVLFADGLRDIGLNDATMRLGELRGWSDVGRSELDRFGLLVSSARRLSVDFGPRRFDFDLCSGEWSLAGVILGRSAPVPMRSICAWPGRAGEWLILEPDGRTLRRHRGPWRVQDARSPSRRVEKPVAVVDGELARALTDWWQSGRRSVLALRQIDGTQARAQAPYRIERRDSEGGRWRIEAETLRAEHLERALRESWQKAPQWLRGDLRWQARSKGSTLELRFDPPAPDLLERLAHPLLWLDDDQLPRHEGRPGTRSWRFEETGTIRLPAQSSLQETAVALRGDRVPVVLLFSAAAPASMRDALRGAWSGRAVFAQALADWAARTPISGEAASPTPGPTLLPGASLYLRIDDEVLPSGERERALQRLQALAQAVGIAVQEVRTFESLKLQPDDAVARIARLPLHAGEPLLRAAELAHWLRYDAEISAHLWRQEPGSPERAAAAREVEARLLRDGRLLPLWSLPLHLELPQGLVIDELRPVGMPPLLWNLRVRGCER